jgi:hypothetical protein
MSLMEQVVKVVHGGRSCTVGNILKKLRIHDPQKKKSARAQINRALAGKYSDLVRAGKIVPSPAPGRRPGWTKYAP